MIEYKDYIKSPKSNGYQSLHLIMQIPVFLSDRVEDINVEIQIRTIGMEFWASLEHKIYYKYNKDVPLSLKDELKETATIVSELDERMEKLNKKMVEIKDSDNIEDTLMHLPVQGKSLHLLENFLDILETGSQYEDDAKIMNKISSETNIYMQNQENMARELEDKVDKFDI